MNAKAPQKTQPVAGVTAPTYRIGELAEQAGVSREMIKYYLRAGLLPQPSKPRPNLSLYSEHHIALIGLILRFQAQTKLSLTEIASVFESGAYDPATIELLLLSDKYSTGESGTILPFDDGVEETGNLELPAAFLQQLIDAGLLSDTNPLSDQQRQSAGLLQAAHQAGVPLDFFTQAREGILALADLEVQTMMEIQRPDLHFHEVIESITDIDKIINRWIIQEKTNHARNTFSRIIENSEKALTTVHDAIYVPSKVFLQRYNVDAEMQALYATAKTKKASQADMEAACRTAVLLAKFDMAIELADHALGQHKHAVVFTALKCLALGMNRQLDDALAHVENLTASGSQHPLALEARLLAMLMQAARLSSVSDPSQILKEAADLFREPTAFVPRTKIDKFEAGLLAARAKTLFPDAFAWRDDIPLKLEAMLEELIATPSGDQDLPLEATRQVFRIYGAYYLGQLYADADDHTRARHYFEEVIKLDPASNFGQLAYLKLS
ncbi:MAG: MerR family transcriptional regulator [Halioglobus sp.]